ncbi:hypothetical protein ACHGLA_00475 [Streptomyces sp. YH02]|uniref:hypothetical protein n=1 Tax=Streptomyces sp. YH02 TaxID=3256999 RepID=UPI00375805CA
MPSAAYALNNVRTWNASASPLVVNGYGSTGKAYGTWKLYNGSNGTVSHAAANTKLSNADNHKVYIELNTQVNAGYCTTYSKFLSCTQQYWSHASDESDHHSSSSYKYNPASTGVSGDADYARGRVKAFLDIPWRDDPETGWSYAAGADNY